MLETQADKWTTTELGVCMHQAFALGDEQYRWKFPHLSNLQRQQLLGHPLGLGEPSKNGPEIVLEVAFQWRTEAQSAL